MKRKNLYLSSNIQYLRNLTGKTQRDLASYCNKANTAISNWEKAIREPNIEDLIKIAQYFDVQIDDLMTEDLSLKQEKKNKNLKPYIIYEDKDTGLTVAFVQKNIRFEELPKEKQEEYIENAMDALYEYKRTLKNKK